MRGTTPEGLVLGFQPTSQGFGWVAFSSPLSFYDCGHFYVKKRKNLESLARLEKLIARLGPRTIVLEAYDGAPRRSHRVVRLCKAVVALAIEQRIEVAIYKRSEITACFGSVGAASRQEVAEAVARSFEALRPRLPKARKPWDGPDRQMAIFDAAAGVIAHYQLDASSVLRRIVGEAF
jgi:Holliday junction resolvasome RuvABC endonuclease subunit